MDRLYGLLTVLSLSFVAAIVWPADAVGRFLEQNWPSIDLRADQSLTLDRVAHELTAVDAPAAQRSKAFNLRALLHPFYSGSAFTLNRSLSAA
jgi:hypothetical protein